MKIFSVILLLFLLSILPIIRTYNRSVGKSWARLLCLGFIVVFILTVSFPELASAVAKAVGLGRGSDLVFYLSAMGLILLAGASLLKFRSVERRQAALIRQIALKEFSDLKSSI